MISNYVSSYCPPLPPDKALKCTMNIFVSNLHFLFCQAISSTAQTHVQQESVFVMCLTVVIKYLTKST